MKTMFAILVLAALCAVSMAGILGAGLGGRDAGVTVSFDNQRAAPYGGLVGLGYGGLGLGYGAYGGLGHGAYGGLGYGAYGGLGLGAYGGLGYGAYGRGLGYGVGLGHGVGLGKIW